MRSCQGVKSYKLTYMGISSGCNALYYFITASFEVRQNGWEVYSSCNITNWDNFDDKSRYVILTCIRSNRDLVKCILFHILRGCVTLLAEMDVFLTSMDKYQLWCQSGITWWCFMRCPIMPHMKIRGWPLMMGGGEILERKLKDHSPGKKISKVILQEK